MTQNMVCPRFPAFSRSCLQAGDPEWLGYSSYIPPGIIPFQAGLESGQ
ncbi:MAG: hypothetical protein K9K37_04850 [Desulfocapsa sp.]|nr:hypothetical protein [Desulfocapsa sp.]